MFKAWSLPGEGNRIFLTTEVEQADNGAEHRRNTGCQGGTCHSHLEREHKDIIKDDVKQACGDGSDHSDGGVVVIPNKRACGVARHIEERKGEDTAEVGNAEILQCAICTEKSKKIPWKKQSSNHERDTCECNPKKGLQEEGTDILSSCLPNTVSRRAADSDHGADGIHHAVQRNHQI